MDRNRDGHIPASAALAVLRQAAPATRDTTLRRVALALWMQDVGGTGAITLRALLQVMRCIF